MSARTFLTMSFIDAMRLRVESSTGEPMGAIECARIGGVLRFSPDADLAAWACAHGLSPELLGRFVRTTAAAVLDVPGLRAGTLDVSSRPRVPD